ncbi:MAG TPA: hypothetical protein VGI95_11685 [Caulobacteraceae bacterium]|jgi:hypothetical protein
MAPAWALAGPPYVTDDPAPTDRSHWEIYAYGNGLDASGAWSGESGLDMNYGAAKDLQLTLVVPAAYSTDGSGQVGMGMIEAAAKYRFAHQSSDGVDVAFFPRAFLPSSSRGLGSDRVSVLLPVWAEKDWGDWSLFGGGGWQWNPGPDQHSFWTGGLALTRTLSERLSAGGEVWAHTKDAPDGRDFAGVNLGVDYRLSRHWSLLASGGPGLLHAADEGRWDFYLALKADY